MNKQETKFVAIDKNAAMRPSVPFYVIEFVEDDYHAKGSWWRGYTEDESSTNAWTWDITKATRFADRESAERQFAVSRLHPRSHAVTEHTWIARELDAAQPAPNDREKDRERFSDPAFNRWLDEGISDAGHAVYDTIGDLSDAWAAWQAAVHYCDKIEAQPAQAGEAVAWQARVMVRGDWLPWEHIDNVAAFRAGPFAFNLANGTAEVRPLYLHPQPEQPASAVEDALRELVNAGNALSFAAQLTGGVAGRDEALVAAIDAWTKARDAATAPPAVSPPSVVAVAPKVAVSDEDVEVALTAFGEAAQRMPAHANPGDSIVGPLMRAALESFASRMGSGERDAVDAARYRFLRNGGWEVLQDPKYWTPDRKFDGAIDVAQLDVALDAALAQQSDKRGGA